MLNVFKFVQFVEFSSEIWYSKDMKTIEKI